MAPFVYSGGGDLFDDDTDPTSLAFSDESTQDALETILTLFRDPKLTLSQEQLDEKTPLEWFEEGKVGMITGTRAMVPELRAVQDLRFDVMPIPSIEGAATVGEISGLCISQDAESPATAADFMVYASSTEAVQRGRARGLPPAGQPGGRALRRLPPARREAAATATVFNEAVGRMVIPPLLDTWDELEDAVEPFLLEMFFAVPTIDLPLLGERSTPCLAADPQPEETPTPTPETEASDSDPDRPASRAVRSRLASAASTASASSGAVSRTCHARAPMSRSATEIARVSGSSSRDVGRRPQHAAQEVGRQQVLGGDLQLLRRAR